GSGVVDVFHWGWVQSSTIRPGTLRKFQNYLVRFASQDLRYLRPNSMAILKSGSFSYFPASSVHQRRCKEGCISVAWSTEAFAIRDSNLDCKVTTERSKAA